MSGSKSSSSTAQSTTVNNQQVGASEGATAIGAGANVNVTTLDAALGETAIREVGNVASDANKAVTDTAKTAINSTAGTARDALDFGGTNVAQVFDFAKQTQADAAGREQNLLNFARQQGELVAAGAGVTPPAQVSDLSKQIVTVVAVLVVGVVAFVYLNRKKAA
jgi:hypothetical protein